MAITEAPYNRHGDLCHHPDNGRWYDYDEPVPPGSIRTAKGPYWRPVTETVMTLVYSTFARGRSAAYFKWINQADGTIQPMFLADMDAILIAGVLTGTTITGRFTVVKRGQNYGLAYLGPADGEQ